MGAASIIKVAILGEEKGLKEAVHLANEDLDHLSKKAKTTSEKAGAFAKKAVAVMGAGALAIAGIAIKNGDELNESEDQLANSLDNAGQHVGNLTKKLAPLQNRMERYGYTNVQVNESIRAQIEAHVPLAEAMKREQLIADLAAKKHLDLATATMLVTKAGEGFTKPLKAMGLDLPIAAGGAIKLKAAEDALAKAHAKVHDAAWRVRDAEAKATAMIADAQHRHLTGAAAAKVYSRAHDLVWKATDKLNRAKGVERLAQQKVNDTRKAGGKILTTLTKITKGGAEESTKSLAVKTAALKAKFTDMTAHLGQKLIPIVIKLGTWFGKLVEYFTNNKAALITLIAVVGTFVAAMVTMSIVEKVTKFIGLLTKANEALNGSFLLNPIVLTVAAIAALTAGVIYAYRNFKWFHHAVDDVWQALQIGFHWVQHNWPLLLAILTGPFGLAVLLISRNWDTIVGFVKVIPGRIASFASHMWSGVTGAWDTAVHWIGQRGEDIISWFSNLPGNVVKALRYVGSAITSPFRAAFNIVAGLWNNTIGKVHFSVPSWVPFVGGDGWGFPQMPTFHTGGIFNSGRGEGVALLRDGEGVFTPGQMRALSIAGGAGGTTIVNAHAPMTQRELGRIQRAADRRNGRR